MGMIIDERFSNQNIGPTSKEREKRKNLLSVLSYPSFSSSAIEISNPCRVISCQHVYLITNGNMNSQFECENELKLRLYHLFALTLQLTSKNSMKEN